MSKSTNGTTSAETSASATDIPHLRAVADILPQLVWSCRPDGYCDYLSRRWVEYTGVPEALHHGSGWLDAVHPDDRAATGAAWIAFVDGRSEYDVSYRLRRHDGEYCWFKTRGVLVRTESGEPLRVVGTTTDINDQKRAEERDRESRERLDAALSASGTGTFRWDIQTNALDWDEQLDRLFGLPPGHTVRSLDKFVERVHPDDRAGVLERCLRCKDEGADFAMEFRVVWPDGAVHWLDDRGRTFLDQAGRPAYMTGACVDITDRKQSDERYRELDERATFVRKASGVGFWYCDLPFDVLEWDDLVKAHFHLAPGASVTIGTFYERIHPDDREPTRLAIERSIADHEAYDVHYRTVHPETGAEKWIRAIGRTFYAPDGTPRQFDGVTLDVTTERRAEERRQFLADLGAATQPLTDPAEVTALTARMLAEHLRCDRCAYAEVEDESIYVITGDYTHGVSSIVGRWPVAAFGAEHQRMMRADEPYVVHDADSDTRIGPDDLPAYRATRIQAVVCVPLLKDGRFTAAMAVHQASRRQWTADDVELVRMVVGRCWEALERARAARARKESEKNLRLITDSVPALIAFVDADQRYRFVNREYEEWFGRPRAEFEGRHLREVIGEAAYDQLRPFVERGLAGERFEFEALGPYPTGDRYIHAAFVPRIDDGRVTGYLSLITDVSDRVRAQEALRDSEARLRSVTDAARVGLVMVDEEHRYRFANRAYAEVLGLPSADIVGLRVAEVLAPVYEQQIRPRLNQAFAGERVSYELRLPPLPGGGPRFCAVAYEPRTEPSGEKLVVVVIVDVTERLRAEEQLRDADRRKDEFLAILAHELRNPLAPIRNGLQVMRLAADNMAIVAKSRDMMDRQLTHMVRLVDDLLDVSRISRGKMELRRERILLSDVVASAVETARPAIDAAGHILTVSVPPGPVYLDGDLTRLAQVFSNLLTNSAKYTPAAGQIWLAAEPVGCDVVVSVRDTGVGIPAEAQPRIFDMFSQVDRSLERSMGGLGIGLALVKGLVEMHGGSVVVQSEGQGRGSTFTVRLPLSPSQPVSEPAAPADGRAVRGPRRKILVVDDNRDSAQSMAEMLTLLGHQVVTAHDGASAVDVAEAFRPQVVFMDVGMPGMNGLDATRAIRERAWGCEVTIVALTGWGQESDRAKSEQAGCDGHLVKPIHMNDVEPYLVTTRRR